MEVLKEDAEHKERVREVTEAICGASHILPIITERHSTYCFVIRFFCLPCPRRLRRLASMVLLVGSRLPRVVFAVLVSDDSSRLNRFRLYIKTNYGCVRTDAEGYVCSAWRRCCDGICAGQ